MSNAHKLHNLKLKKVDFVDQGANQHAHIRMTKRKDDGDTAVEDTAQPTPEERAFFERLGAFVAKIFHAPSPASQTTDIEKGNARNFEQVNDERDTRGAIYRIADSMTESIFAIMNDDELDDSQKAAMIVQTADQVADAIKEDIASIYGSPVQKGTTGDGEDQLAEGKEPESNPDDGKAEEIDKSASAGIEQEGEKTMELDTNRMTPEDKAAYEELTKRYSANQNAKPSSDTVTENVVDKPSENTDDVYKGLHPAVKAELENLRKFRETAEDRECLDIAKRYELLGKKPEELAKTLKSLKQAGGSAYADMIGILDSNLEAMQKSGVFSEIGKRGDTSNGDDAWGKIETAAQEIMKSNSNMRWADAVDAACVRHPELVEEYEKSRK